MFSLFKQPHSDCPRCGSALASQQASAVEKRYCTQCGLDLDLCTSELLLPYELAIGFHVPHLGNFLRLQASTHAALPYRVQIFQYGHIHELEHAHVSAQSDKALAFDHSAAAGILISRRAQFTCTLKLSELHTAEFLPLDAEVQLQISIASNTQFARTFMAGHCRVNETHLQGLFAASARQACLEVINAHSLRELQDQATLAAQLETEIRLALQAKFEEMGLQLNALQIIELRHDKLSEAREELGEKLASYYLIADEKRAKNEHRKTLDTLYSEAEWQQIARDEERVRLRYRHEEMRQQLGNDLSWLYLRGEHENAKKRLSRAKLRQDEAERLHAIQLRELELYARIAEASTRKEAVERGAASTIAELEHQLRAKKEQQQNENDEWLHIRTLARIKMRSESELAQMHSKEAAQLLQQKIAHQLQSQRLAHEIELNQRNAQGLRQEEQAAWLHDQERKQQLREQALEEEAHQTRLLSLSLETEVRAREFKRLQDWEDQLAQQRRHQHQHQTAREQALADQEHALVMARMQHEIKELEHRYAVLENQTQHDKLQRTLALEAQFAEQEQARALLKMERLAALDEHSQIVFSDKDNAELLAELAKLKTMSSMSPEQILATQASASAHAAVAEVKRQTHGLSWEDTVRMLHERVEEERAQREAEQLRRHEIDLQNAQIAATRMHPANLPRK